MLGFQALSFWIGSPYFFHHTVRVCLHAESNIMCIAYIFIGFLLIAHFVIAVLVIVASVVVVVAIFGPKFCMRCTHTHDSIAMWHALNSWLWYSVFRFRCYTFRLLFLSIFRYSVCFVAWFNFFTFILFHCLVILGVVFILKPKTNNKYV